MAPKKSKAGMPRKAKPQEFTLPSSNLVIDNGGYSIKAGFAQPEAISERDCHIIPNCIARSNEGGRSHNVYIADQLEECKDTGEMVFRRPVEKGYIVNWDSELDIWKQAFFRKGAKIECEPHDTNLILTEAPNCPQNLQSNTDQIIFEEFEFASAYRCLGSTLNAFNDIASLTGDQPSKLPLAECVLVIDSGYSSTTVTPVLYGRPIQPAIKRLDVGGRTMTNLLKELASLRHWNLMDDGYLVSQIKEDSCYVTQNFKGDMERVRFEQNARKNRSKSVLNGLNDPIVRDYVLPDYRTTFRGYLRPTDETSAHAGSDQSFLPLGNERFAVPEIIFNPSDIGLSQAGLPEVVIQSLSCLRKGMWPGMLANIAVIGGNAKLPGFLERLEADLRALTPAECTLRVRSPEDPVTFTWHGGCNLANQPDHLKKVIITREEYQEHGANWTLRQFASGPRQG